MIQKNQDWLKDYLSSLKRGNKSSLTVLNYRKDLEKFLYWADFCENLSLHRIRPPHISKYLYFLELGEGAQKTPWWRRLLFFKKTDPKILRCRPLKISSRKRHLSSLNNFLEFLYQSYPHKFSENPVKNKIHYIKLKDNDVEHTKLIRDEDWAKLEENVIMTTPRLMLFLLYYGGLRIHELAALRWSQIDWHTQTVNIIRKGGKRHHFRPQRAEKIFELLKYQKLRQREQDFVFLNQRKTSFSTRALYQKVKNLLHQYGCQAQDLSPHSFRKACATRLYRRTKDLLFVRDYLNHSDAKVTQTYIDKVYTSGDLTSHQL